MNVAVYRTAGAYWLLDDRSHPPLFHVPAELVFSLTDAHLTPEVAQMLAGAIEQSGVLELRPTWADYLFRDCAGWNQHKSSCASVLIG